MNIILWLLAGALLGWLMTLVLRRRHPDYLLNIIVGMVGAFVAGYLLPWMLRISPINPGSIGWPSLLIAAGGALTLLVIINFLRRENNFKGAALESRWAQVCGQIHTRWNKLTEADLAEIEKHPERLNPAVQSRYGLDATEAEDQIQRYLKSTLVDTHQKETSNGHKETL